MTMRRTIAKIPLLLVSAVISICLSANATAYDDIVNDEFGFYLRIPDGFVKYPKATQDDPNIIHAYILGDPADKTPDILLTIVDPGGTFGPERLKREQMPAGSQGRLFTTRWQGLEIDVIEVQQNKNGKVVLMLTAQIPLTGRDIQVRIGGVLDRKRELNDFLKEILESLKGESSGLEPGVPFAPISLPSSSKTLDDKYVVVFTVVLIAIIVAGLVAFWVISKYAPKGTVLVVAFVIYAIGSSFGDTQTREMLLLARSMKMLGCAGALLGVFDLYRKRKSKD